MRNVIFIAALLFGMFSIAPNMQGGQLLKIGELIEHYYDHQSSSESFSSFLSFLNDHYFNNSHRGKDEKHMPFKTSVSHVHFQFVHHISEVQSLASAIICEKSAQFFGEPHGILQDRAISVWNPPRSI